jgi:hypothetical protein
MKLSPSGVQSPMFDPGVTHSFLEKNPRVPGYSNLGYHRYKIAYIHSYFMGAWYCACANYEKYIFFWFI